MSHIAVRAVSTVCILREILGCVLQVNILKWWLGSRHPDDVFACSLDPASRRGVPGFPAGLQMRCCPRSAARYAGSATCGVGCLRSWQAAVVLVMPDVGLPSFTWDRNASSTLRQIVRIAIMAPGVPRHFCAGPERDPAASFYLWSFRRQIVRCLQYLCLPEIYL